MVMHVGKAWRGRLVNWVEKSSFEKIRRLLEVYERKRHCKVLLTPENIFVVRHNPAPYNLPIIPRPLPQDVVEGEHFVVADLRRLVSRGASSSRDPVVEASSRVQGVGSMSGASTSSSGSSSSSPPPAPGRGTRRGHPERPPLPMQVPGPAPRVVRINWKGELGRRNAPGSKGEDFVPWVPPIAKSLRIWKRRSGGREGRGCLIAMLPARGSDRWFPAVSRILPLSRLWDRACRLSKGSLLLTEVLGTKKSSSPALPNRSQQMERSRALTPFIEERPRPIS